MFCSSGIAVNMLLAPLLYHAEAASIDLRVLQRFLQASLRCISQQSLLQP
jgi:hypothetical protein